MVSACAFVFQLYLWEESEWVQKDKCGRIRTNGDKRVRGSVPLRDRVVENVELLGVQEGLCLAGI